MMLYKDIPIQTKLMRILFLISSMIILVTSITFFIYEIYTFRKSTTEKLSTIGKIIATNSTAALAFDDTDAGRDILAALKAEPHIIAASLYNKDGKLFAYYSNGADTSAIPHNVKTETYHFIHSTLEGFQPIMEESKQVGTLYLKSDLSGMYERLQLYGLITILVIIITFLLAYGLSRILQKSISMPILSLAKTARQISVSGDYTHRAVKIGDDETGLLTDSFNQMLERIQKQNGELAEFALQMEQRVRERTTELETVNKELESFSYSISHDLRAPLRSIIGFTAMLEEDYIEKLDDEAKRITGVIKRNTAKMGVLIDDLLTFSRMGRQSITKTTVNFNKMVGEIIAETYNNNPHHTIDWKIGELPDAQADNNIIRQVWVNLISNAVKYSHTRENAHIEIGTHADNDNIIYFIKDNGVGFDEKYKDKLFKVFQRLHSADEFEGTGVGLAIVERVITKHGGKVWAEATKDVGATFYFSLPQQ